MATVGLLASWGAALFAAWAFIGGMIGITPEHPARRSAERALVASAIAAAVATAALVQLLLAGDVTIAYVARSIATNLANGYRVAALWNLPSGAVLPTATLAALVGGITTARARSSLGVAAVGAIVMALVAASLAAAPFSTLPWVPTEGLGLSPALQHPMAVAGRVALSFAIAAATGLVALAADRLASPHATVGALASAADVDAHDQHATTVVAGLAVTCIAVAMWSTARGSFATGTAASPASLSAWGGALIPALVSAVFALLARKRGGTGLLAAALGALGLLSAVLLGRSAPRAGGWALDAFALLSLAAAATGAAAAVDRARGTLPRVLDFTAILLLTAGAGASLWLVGGGLQWLGTFAQWCLVMGLAAGIAADGIVRPASRWLVLSCGVAGAALGLWLGPVSAPTTGWSIVAGLALGAAVAEIAAPQLRARSLAAGVRLLALALAALASAGEGRATSSIVELSGGGTTTVATRFGAPLLLSHQGISRYQDGNAHVAALALEPSRGGRAQAIVSTDRREYVDSRDEILGPPTTRPVIVPAGVEEVRITVDKLDRDERAQLRLTVVPFGWAWPLSVVTLVLASLLQVRPRSARATLPASTETVTA